MATMNKYLKTLLPTDWYHMTIRQSYKAEDNPEMRKLGDNLVWCLTVNTGQFKWYNLIDTFDPSNQHDMVRLHEAMDAIGQNIYEPDHPEFYEQFIGMRFLVNVTRQLKGDMKRNVILEYKLDTDKPEIDVLAPKDNSHFNENTKGKRDLPI